MKPNGETEDAKKVLVVDHVNGQNSHSDVPDAATGGDGQEGTDAGNQGKS